MNYNHNHRHYHTHPSPYQPPYPGHPPHHHPPSAHSVYTPPNLPPPPPPSLTLQRPSYPHPNSLPPIEHIRPGSISDPHHPLNHPHHTHPPPHTHPSQSSSHLYRQPSYPSSVPHHPSGLRYATKTSPSADKKSPTFDLSQYSMTHDEKPKSSGSNTNMHHSPTTGSEGHSPHSSRHARTLPPLQMPSPTPVQPPRQAHTLSPNEQVSSRKRGFDEIVTTPGSEHSRSSSSVFTVTTPQSERTERPLKRRASIIDDLLVNKDKEGDVKPNINPGAVPSWNDWERRGSTSLSALLTSDTKGALEKLAEMPIRPTSPITAFPLQFGFTTGGLSNNGAPGSGSANPQDRNLNIDPALSSVRSSADQAANSAANSPPFQPELRFTEETLNSATGSPAINVLEAALQHANANNAAESSTSGQQDDENRLTVPESDDKKEQPFSRSPELRVSHKLAERKRRKEMKELFDELRELLPAERGSKSSKWEILSKAIDFINSLKSHNADLKRELDKAHRDLGITRGGATGAYPTYPYGLPYQPQPGSYPPMTSAATAGSSVVGAGVTLPPTQQNQAQNGGQPQLQEPAASPGDKAQGQ